ncbi:MAG: peptidylprolyl isomerase [Bacteroidota bacterium]
MARSIIAAVTAALLFVSCASGDDGSLASYEWVPADTLELPQTNLFAVETDFGTMTVRLFDETPVHRDNFKRLAAHGFFDELTFHRIIDGFVIQGGDPTTRTDSDPMQQGSGGPGYTLEAEIQRGLDHRRGALAAARQGDLENPERRSSGSQFYIVHGRPFTDQELDDVEVRIRATADSTFAFTEEERERYRTHGGAPFLDLQYTVFGELISGFDVLDAVARVETPRSAGRQADPALMDRPIQTVKMRVYPVEDPPAN